jgi:uncharacterized membrane protein YbhN (UPF0104 family)
MPDLVAESTTPTAGVQSAAPRSRVRSLVLAGIRIAVVLAIVGSVVYATVSQWQDVRATILGLAWQSVLLSLVMALIGMAANTLAWRAALDDLEHRVSVPAAGRIYLVGQLAKYLPGSIWAYALQMELGRRAGLPRARAFLASLVATGLSVTAALVLGVFGLQSLFDAAHSAEYGASGRTALYGLVALVPIAVVCAHPRVLTWLIQQFLRLVRRPPLEHVLTWGGVLRVVGWSAVAWVAFGVHLWLLANAQAAPGPGAVLLCIGAFALAMTAGLFAVLSPSGLGVREAVLVAALAPFVSTGPAVGIALASRLLFTAADIIAAAAAALSGVRHLRDTTNGDTTRDTGVSPAEAPERR